MIAKPGRMPFGGTVCLLAVLTGLAGFVGQGCGVSRGPVPDRPASDGGWGRADPTPPVSGEESAGGATVETTSIEDGGVGIANLFTGPIHDPGSLAELRDAVLVRGRLGRAVVESELESLHLDAFSPRADVVRGLILRKNLGYLSMYEGEFAEASAAIEKALDDVREAGGPKRERAELLALLGIIALRRGEVDNCVACVGPSSCILPIAPEAAHKQQAGSREAIARFTASLAERPDDLRVRWLLNLAHMTLSEYPDKVPRPFLIPIDVFKSEGDVGRFVNVAEEAGLTARGPNLAGGSVFDDFNGDGRPDLFTTSLDATRGASLLVNRGDGTFEDRSDSAGLADQVYALNVSRTDFDNDGALDVLLLRGAWEKPMRLSLLKNDGHGAFKDVTLAAGLGTPISSEAAVWGDYDDDGRLDLFVCGEYYPPVSGPAPAEPDPRNRCRLYHNQGDGTFVDVAASAGVAAELCSKGAAWGDYDGDGRLDLFVSNFVGPCRLYRNRGDGRFEDVAPSLGVGGKSSSFACWVWDYDNDGRLDLFVNESSYSLAREVAVMMGLPPGMPSRPRLYRNLGPDGFRDVTRDVGLARPVTPMGCNFGDLDNDGYLEIYQGTGGMSLEHLVPNRLFHNVSGRKFEDVTTSSGTGHLQKGHGVAFADYDDDGDLDLFVEVGGAVPSDVAYNLLFRNPGHGRHWLKVKLVGKTTNRAAIGARIKAVTAGADGATRAVYRTVGNNSSFGGNPLVELIGLGDATAVSELEVSWPTSRTTQTFRDIPADRTVEITEGADSFVARPRREVR